MVQANYMDRKNQLIKTFDGLLARIKPEVVSWLGEEQASRFMRDSRQEYEALIPRIPFIGNDNLALTFYFPTARYLAVYRGLQRQGRAVEDAGWLIYQIAIKETQAIPSIIRRILAALWFSPMLKNLLKKRGAMSQKRRYPENWVLEYVPGDGREFDYGVDYFECANCKLLRAEDAFELAPYLCATDQPISELAGWGLTRTMTLAEGFPKCDFRFKKGGATRVVIPQTLQAMIDSKTA